MNDLAAQILQEKGDELSLTYEQARELAAHQDTAVREALAANGELEPEILYYLASDSDPAVRRAAAVNLSTPHKAHLKLAEDTDDQVRSSLVEKIAKLTPNLSADEQDAVRQSTYETLEILARDELTRVRQILSETLKDVAAAPPDLILKLARDTEIEVAGPVLEFSPVLTDELLLEIIESGPAKGALGAISRRDEVSETVSDAVVGTDDIEAIGELLSNSSAQIREEALDDLIDRAEGIELWQAPLIGRPHLTSRAASRLAHFVADNLLDVLQARTDLDKETLEAVKTAVHRRVSHDGEESESGPGGNGAPKEDAPLLLDGELPLALAERLLESGKLDAKVLKNAIQANDLCLVLAALTVRSSVTQDVVKKVFSGQNPKGIIALTWRSNLSMEMAVLMQERIGRIPPIEVLGPKSDGSFPLSEDEMKWQLEFFGDLASKGTW